MSIGRCRHRQQGLDPRFEANWPIGRLRIYQPINRNTRRTVISLNPSGYATARYPNGSDFSVKALIAAPNVCLLLDQDVSRFPPPHKFIPMPIEYNQARRHHFRP
jgi:hypothetical protein